MTEKPKHETDNLRPSEDDLAQTHLGGPRGAPELAPAKMTPQEPLELFPSASPRGPADMRQIVVAWSAAAAFDRGAWLKRCP